MPSPSQIAVRIVKTAKELGIRTVAVYTNADATSLHVSSADEAVLLPGSNSSAYTEGDEIIKIAKEKKADAIIPGYGFLSENADFARSVGEAGMVWVGPSPRSIDGKAHTSTTPEALLIPNSFRDQACGSRAGREGRSAHCARNSRPRED